MVLWTLLLYIRGRLVVHCVMMVVLTGQGVESGCHQAHSMDSSLQQTFPTNLYQYASLRPRLALVFPLFLRPSGVLVLLSDLLVLAICQVQTICYRCDDRLNLMGHCVEP
jgi:hypothetical protein